MRCLPNTISTSAGNNTPNMDLRLSSSGGPNTPMDSRFPGGNFPIPSSPLTPSGQPPVGPSKLTHSHNLDLGHC